MGDTLIESWAESRLGDIVTSRKGKKPKKLLEAPTDNSVPYIDIRAFERGEIRQYADPSESTLVNPGDIIVVWDGARCGLVGKTSVRGALGSTLIHLGFNNLFPEYLKYFLQSHFEEINTNPRGSGITHVNPELFWELTVPIAPIAEQKRIVARVEELLLKVDSVKQRLERASQVMKRFRQTVLSAACSGKLTEGWREEYNNETAENLVEYILQERKGKWILINQHKKYKSPVLPNDNVFKDSPESWVTITMDALTSQITSGSRDWKKYYSDVGTGTFILTQNVRPMSLDLSYLQKVEPPLNDRDRTRSSVKEDDLLINIAGNIGQVCRFNKSESGFYVSQSVALMRLVLPEISPYLELFLNSPKHGQAQYQNWLYGEGRPHLSFDHLRSTTIFLPPLTEQHEIVRRVEGLFSLADTIEQQIEAAKQKVERLSQSILSKAFRGELVTTEADLARQEGRYYEPASVLVERIKEERQNSLSKSRRKTR